MVYLKIFFADNYKLGQPSTVFDLLLSQPNIFEKYGVQLVETIKESNLIVANRMDCFFTHSKRPVIICSRYDSSSLGSSYWNYSDPLVKAVFTDYLPRDKEHLKNETIKKRYHYKILHDLYGSDYKIDEQLKDIDKYLYKIRQVSWFIPYTHLSLNKHMKFCSENRYKMEKDIDIFCVFHSHDKDSMLAEHRKNIQNIVKGMKDLKVVYGNNLDQNEYHEKLLRSKICIAPWGLGERIAVDQKGILAGCIVLKPDTDFLLTFPDLYNEKYYVKFNQDLSNMEEVCRNTLANHKSLIKKTTEAIELFNNTTYEKYVERFCDNVKEVYKSK